MKFDIVWENYIQEEARVDNREALLREDDQVLAIHSKRRKQSNFKKDSHRPPNKFQKKRKNNQMKYYLKYQCYNYHKIGHLSRECPSKKKNKKLCHAHIAEDEDEEEEERHLKRLTKQEEEVE